MVGDKRGHKLLHNEDIKGRGKEQIEGMDLPYWVTYSLREQHSEILNHALSVEEVIRAYEEVPAQCPKPWQFVRLVDNISNGDDLMETFNLDDHHLKIEGHGRG